MQKHMFSFIKLTVLIILSFTTVNAQQLDMVIFGNENSEAEHNFSFSNASAGAGGLNESYRKLEGTDIESSYLSVTLKVDPDAQNYLTLKFWGSDTLAGRKNIYLYYWKTFFGTLGKWAQIGSPGTENEIIDWSTKSYSWKWFINGLWNERCTRGISGYAK